MKSPESAKTKSPNLAWNVSPVDSIVPSMDSWSSKLPFVRSLAEQLLFKLILNNARLYHYNSLK